ncbi:hypothetical protein [Spelaeicoccus albus]|uniref:Uncharacterized protein n=1 Tax=Spelaeicoccus albus TaxID=1280376 RepID=A0A7Z0A9I5_9MICO|nr:hypothetical protein [Spelaeicoccus albus]NYI66892.1 hypothetical protein [Spelaeicoccus albus]
MEPQNHTIPNYSPQSDSTRSHEPAQSTRRPPARWTGEKTAWWIAFGILVLSIFFMLGLWN